jgi:hypothetical protein
MTGDDVTLGYISVTRRSHIVTENNVRFVSNPMKHTLRLIEGNNAARAADPVDSRIRDFLIDGNDGSELFAALYGHVGREPIPERIALLLPNQEREPTPPSLPEPGKAGRVRLIACLAGAFLSMRIGDDGRGGFHCPPHHQ